MYSLLLFFHSLFRWIVLAALLYSLYRAYHGWFTGKSFRKQDDVVRNVTVTTVHLQFTIGLILYFISPIVRYFLHNFKEAVHERDIRFFGMEHITMMLISVVLITIGSSSVKRKKTDAEKFKTMAIWFSIALLIIFASIPWPFSPFTSRPYIPSI